MIRHFLLLVVGLCAAEICVAEEQQFATLKVGSETYSNVTVTSVTATDIYFNHSRGIGNAKIKKLDPELQKKFHFDPTKAAANQSQQAEAQARYLQSVMQAKPAAPAKPAPEPEVQAKREPAGASGSPDDIIPEHPIHAKSFLHRAAPEIYVQKWLGDTPDMAGKFVLVDFWATWCPPCRASIPGLNRLYERFKDRVVFIGISDETEEAVRKMTNPKIEYAVGIDPQRQSANLVGVKGIPHALLIDPKGIVRFEGMPHYLDADNLRRLIEKYGG